MSVPTSKQLVVFSLGGEEYALPIEAVHEIMGSKRVVAADDSRLMRRMLSDALGRHGFDVVATAADGDEAPADCRDHRPGALTPETTCTIYGMPRAVAEAGLADEILPLDELPDAIARRAGA